MEVSCRLDAGKIVGKGSGRRPSAIGKAAFDAGWERAFGAKPPMVKVRETKARETYYICVSCLTETTQLPPDGLDYCPECERIAEGNTLMCTRELDE